MNACWSIHPPARRRSRSIWPSIPWERSLPCRTARRRWPKRQQSAPTSPTRYPQAKLAPPPGDPRRAKYLYWLFFAPSCIEPAIIQIFTKLQVPTSTAGWGDATQVFDVLDKALEKGPWLLGEEFAACDVVIGSGLNFAIRQFKMVPSRPSFDRYLERCLARPAYQRAAQIAGG